MQGAYNLRVYVDHGQGSGFSRAYSSITFDCATICMHFQEKPDAPGSCLACFSPARRRTDRGWFNESKIGLGIRV